MKIDANFTANQAAGFLGANSGTSVSVSQTINFDFGDTNRLNNLTFGNTEQAPSSLFQAPENQTQNSAAMDFFKSALTMFAKMLGLDPQKLLQMFNGTQPTSPTNNYTTGAGAINNIKGKAADKASDPKIREAMEQMQAQQAANPGKPVKMKVKGSDGKKYNLTLDENGNMEIKKKKSGFLSGLFKGIGKIFQAVLPIAKMVLPFIPGWGQIASIGLGVAEKMFAKKA